MKQRKPLPLEYFLLSLLLAIGLHFIVPLKKLIDSPYNYYGVLLIGIGIWLNIWADLLFKSKQTAVKPFEKTTCLIQEGPFRFMRHPMYSGMVLMLLGTAIFLGSMSPFAAVPGFFILIRIMFIRHEEKVLEESFGKNFILYKKRVRSGI